MGGCFGRITVETPTHTVVEDLTAEHGYEVRQYPAILVSETACDNTEQGNRAAFMKLARYIGVFGTPENKTKDGEPETVAMTAPVLNTGESAEAISMTAPVLNSGGKMAFTLPSKYKTLDSAPKPTNPEVSLREMPAFQAAVFTFTWSTDQADAEKRVIEFAAQLREDHAKRMEKLEDGKIKFALARYNGPMTLPFMKTNEISIYLRNA
mmetsp:Transcript_17685/g.38930  ORF Transcript_17685/g.38930 Transcript_17685/m.38930 type:complete len:209 (-) Transcript_17685:219-845(-)|eukprot:CAMPEP_0204274108 /NCGR_PEP_ID=MMETSP0468-20130131/24998_1 /ASSEMBLY_ACC=CAM_ASM_000383 /TAXON_ID=2969 /ORGANISM="Oxyrrhis marina" /LENGTH=208 /DNA_ID=CAMNT_0051250267 /DNA_START=36 /DNA_END=662 /DNA_ORIENTATION=+